jgi:type I restriction-modification system DNA methylase subunit
MKSSISDTIKKRDTPKDVFYTPQSLVQIHLDLVKPFILENDKILDPFFGEGIYYNNYPLFFTNNNTFDYTEISLEKDFFEYSSPVDVIVSNPPYSMIDKVLEKSVSLTPHTISYLIGHGNLTTRRIEYMNKHGYFLVQFHLTKVWKWYGMSSIITFSKQGKTNCISFDRIVHK